VFLDKTVQDLNEHVQGCTAGLVFNLDEICISDWEDRKTRKVAVRAMTRGQAMHHGISRTVKHISVIACVGAAGESLIAYMIASQDSASVREQLKQDGVRFGAKFVLKSNREPCINAEIFLDYIQTVSLSNLAELGALNAFAADISVLLKGNWSSHVTSDVIGLLTQTRLRVITLAPHTTQIVQVLDLILVGVLKRHPRYELSFEDENARAQFIVNVYHDFKQTMVAPNI
jgi:hypothetical protein